jgi:ribosome-binding protein aMBF1 (putative translation factor)
MTSADTLADWPTNDELIAAQLRADPVFRAEWRRTAIGRAVAIALVRYRADYDLSQRELAGHLGTTVARIEHLELGDVNPSRDVLSLVSS